MPMTIDIPESIQEQLEAALGADLVRIVKEPLAVEGYRSRKLSLGQVARLLSTSIDTASAFLTARGVEPAFSPADLEGDVNSLERLLTGGPTPP